ncbi:MAG: class I fructose-bisphosphate aldolase [Tannerellaceae bacterium]|jgi:class I fructose-bisphosphate aldolase|nr:class I fructose-bisphosphate aldolase [Tannerellaceae bacterium]
MLLSKIVYLLGPEAGYYLNHSCKTIRQSLLHLPSPERIDELWIGSDRNIQTLRSLRSLLAHGRLGGTGYLSILAVDQGVEQTAGAAFTLNPLYFDPENVAHLAIEGGCSALVSSFGLLGAVARKYAHRIPFIVKINHSELLSYPNTSGQIMFGSVRQAWDMGAVAIGAAVDFGAPESRQQLAAVADAFEQAHELGLAAILWCDLRNDHFIKEDLDYQAAADITGQANHLGVSIRADLVKQRLPENNGGFPALNYSAYSLRTYTELLTEHPIDLCRYQVANSYMGRIGLVNAETSSPSADGLKDAILSAVINKRAGGAGLITGPNALRQPLKNGIELLHAVQDIYLDPEITIA